jgi:hypothetical protein
MGGKGTSSVSAISPQQSTAAGKAGVKGRDTTAVSTPEPQQQSWKGKVASKKAYDRSAMRQNIKKPFTSSKEMEQNYQLITANQGWPYCATTIRI